MQKAEGGQFVISGLGFITKTIIQYKSFDDDCVGAFPFRSCKLSIWKVFSEYSSRILPPNLRDSELSHFESATVFGRSKKFEESGFTWHHSQGLYIAMHCQFYLQQKVQNVVSKLGVKKHISNQFNLDCFQNLII